MEDNARDPHRASYATVERTLSFCIDAEAVCDHNVQGCSKLFKVSKHSFSTVAHHVYRCNLLFALQYGLIPHSPKPLLVSTVSTSAPTSCWPHWATFQTCLVCQLLHCTGCRPFNNKCCCLVPCVAAAVAAAVAASPPASLLLSPSWSSSVTCSAATEGQHSTVGCRVSAASPVLLQGGVDSPRSLSHPLQRRWILDVLLAQPGCG